MPGEQENVQLGADKFGAVMFGSDFPAVSIGDVRPDGVIGHRQVTDAYLAQFARHYGGRLATLDTGLAHLHDDVAELVPSGDH